MNNNDESLLINAPDAQQILAERAQSLAQHTTQVQSIEITNWLLFQVDKNQKYAVEYTLIDRVILNKKITTIPGVPSLFSGLIYHNSEIWPVINLHILLECQLDETKSHFILVYTKSHRYAFAVGDILGQIKYDPSIKLTSLPQRKNNYIRGVYQSDIAFIEMSSILNLLENTKLQVME